MEQDLAFWIAAGLATFCVGASKGGLPLLGMLGVPILAMSLPPALAAGLLLPIFLISDAYGIWLFRGNFSRPLLRVMIPAGALGVLTGFLTISVVPAEATKLLVALIGLGYLAQAMARRLRGDLRARRPDLPRGLFWGALAGFTSYISHAGAPPFQAYVLPLRLEKMTFAGTATIYFAAVNFMKLPPYVAAGQVTWESLGSVLVLGPLALVSAWVGHWLTLRLPERAFFAFVETALLLVSLKLAWEVLAP